MRGRKVTLRLDGDVVNKAKNLCIKALHFYSPFCTFINQFELIKMQSLSGFISTIFYIGFQ
jgi:hypothetical protein